MATQFPACTCLEHPDAERLVNDLRLTMTRGVSVAPSSEVRPPAPGVVHLEFGHIEVRASTDERDRFVDVVASTDTIDSYGEIVVQDWKLDRYLKNPIVLYGHDTWSMPIGRASNVRVEEGKLKARLHFASEKANAKAEQVYLLMKENVIRAVSVGFKPGMRAVQTIDGKDTLTLLGNELLEISVVPIPANPDAVALQHKSLRDTAAQLPAQEGPANTKETPPMALTLVTLAALLNLPTDARESDVEGSLKSLKATGTELVQLTDKATPGEALAVVRAWKSAAEELPKAQARVKELETETLAAERAEEIRKLVAAKKLTPAMVKWAETQTPEALRAFGEAAPAIPALASDEREASSGGSGPVLTHEGKTWAQLEPLEKHNLYLDNRPLYDAMKKQAAA